MQLEDIGMGFVVEESLILHVAMLVGRKGSVLQPQVGLVSGVVMELQMVILGYSEDVWLIGGVGAHAIDASVQLALRQLLFLGKGGVRTVWRWRGSIGAS